MLLWFRDEVLVTGKQTDSELSIHTSLATNNILSDCQRWSLTLTVSSSCSDADGSWVLHRSPAEAGAIRNFRVQQR